MGAGRPLSFPFSLCAFFSFLILRWMFKIASFRLTAVFLPSFAHIHADNPALPCSPPLLPDCPPLGCPLMSTPPSHLPPSCSPKPVPLHACQARAMHAPEAHQPPVACARCQQISHQHISHPRPAASCPGASLRNYSQFELPTTGRAGAGPDPEQRRYAR